MTELVTHVAPVSPRLPTWRIVVALARPEATRMLRSPLFYVGLGLSGLFAWGSFQAPDDWSGARYTVSPVLVGPLLVTISMVVAGSFHRERAPVAAEAPVDESVRAASRLLGALALVGVVVVLTAGAAAYVRTAGGLDLGDEPGRTLHAQFTLPEILQNVALAVLAVSVGAAAGRRMRHRASATLVLFVGWFPFVMASWAFRSAGVTPFSIIQIQPVSLEAAPATADPLSLPDSWLLSAPGEFQDHWGHEFVSGSLAGWHDAWLLGLTCLFAALAVPGRWRPVLVGVGVALATTAIAAEYAVIP